MWVLLMEKAYAKLFGAYDKIDAGYESEAMRDLTGAPSESYDIKKAEETWNFISENFD